MRDHGWSHGGHIYLLLGHSLQTLSGTSHTALWSSERSDSVLMPWSALGRLLQLFHFWTLTTQLVGRGAFVLNCKDADRVSRDSSGLFSPFIQRGSSMGAARRTKWENQQGSASAAKCTFQLHHAVHINIHLQTADTRMVWHGLNEKPVKKQNPMTLSARCLEQVFFVIRQPPESRQKQNCGHCYVRKVFMYFLCRWALAMLWGPLMEEWLHESTGCQNTLVQLCQAGNSQAAAA